MKATYAEPALARSRDSVTELMEAGEPFGAVEDAIEKAADLTEDARAALWLLAFSLQKPAVQVRTARRYLASVG
jgi:dihydroneopterin aldolase